MRCILSVCAEQAASCVLVYVLVHVRMCVPCNTVSYAPGWLIRSLDTSSSFRRLEPLCSGHSMSI